MSTAAEATTVFEAKNKLAGLFASAPTETVTPEPEAIAEEVQEQPGEETVQESPTYKVRVDGEEVEVPLDELLKGYSRTSDYTRKTQKVSEERKALEAEAAAVREERQRYAQVLTNLESQLQVEKEPNWAELFEKDPIEASKQFALYQSRKGQLEQVKAEQRRIQEVMAAEQQKQLQSYIADEERKLVSAIPDWTDAKKAKAEKETVLEYARSLGFTDSELAQLYDHRAVVALREAALYRQMTSSAKGKVEANKDSPKSMKPGTVTQPVNKNLVAAKDQFARTGTIKDAKSVVGELLKKRG